MSGKYAPIAGYPDGVYNFGEVLATPILAALDGTPNAWLGELLAISARGDVVCWLAGDEGADEPSTDLAPPRNSQFAPEGKKE